ncbi:MAG: TerB family tellurite resistance protein [Deltaproteobacteria bacterium]|nr:TerB family tellurite resistance protein [Deltaproteobacteria bacterium]
METIQINISLAIFIIILLMSLAADYENKKKERNERLPFSNNTFSDFFSMLAKLCKADGFVKKEEIRLITQYMKEELKLNQYEQQEAISIFNKAKNSNSSFEFHAKRLKRENKENTLFLNEVIELLFFVAVEDSHLSREEEVLIIEAINIFEVHDNAYFRYKEAEAEKEPENDNAPDGRYFLSLGLTKAADPSEIKRSYRKLVKQYHPDNVQHLGVEFLALAEQKMKEINEAYNYLKEKLDF